MAICAEPDPICLSSEIDRRHSGILRLGCLLEFFRMQSRRHSQVAEAERLLQNKDMVRSSNLLENFAEIATKDRKESEWGLA